MTLSQIGIGPPIWGMFCWRPFKPVLKRLAQIPKSTCCGLPSMNAMWIPAVLYKLTARAATVCLSPVLRRSIRQDLDADQAPEIRARTFGGQTMLKPPAPGCRCKLLQPSFGSQASFFERPHRSLLVSCIGMDVKGYSRWFGVRLFRR